MEKMNNILIIDTSTNNLKISININNKEIFIDLNKGFKHIETLLPVIQSLLKKINEKKTDINFIGVCNGPGSFTGIRIGIASAYGISFGLNAKCFGFSVFDVYKYLLKDEKNTVIIPIIDAKKNKFFCAFIENDSDYKMHDYTLEDIKNKITNFKNNKNLIFTGKDFKLIKNKIIKDFNFTEKFSDDYSSKDLLSFSKYYVSINKNLKTPSPIYLRKSEAEIQLLKKKT